MDDANNTDNSKNFTEANPYDTVTTPNSGAPSAPSTPVQSQPVANSDVVYAGFFRRFLAVLIDGILVGAGFGIISAVFGIAGDFARTLGSLLGMVAGYAYYIYFISQEGATLGKQALGLRVQNMETGQNLDVVSTILREVVGKFISGLVLLLGYFWMLWDPKKQTWHDKIAKSVVVKVE